MQLLCPIAQAHPRTPVLQEENLVCARVPVAIDRRPGRQVLGSENQVRRAAVVPIDFQDKWARLGVPALRPFDRPPDAPLTLVLLEDQRTDSAYVDGSVRRDRGRARGGTPKTAQIV